MKRLLYVAISVLLLAAGCAPGAGQAPDGPTLSPPPLEPGTDVPTPVVGTPIPPPIDSAIVEQPQFSSLQMLNEIDGWGATESALLRTNDGGTTWHAVTPGLALVGYGVGSFYLDANRAFVIEADQADPMGAGTLYKTEDGGKTWSSNDVPFGGAQLRFLDTQKGWAMASLGVAAGSNAIAVFQTLDGGQTWDRTFDNDPNVAGSSREIPLGGLKGTFFPLNMQTAWIGGVVYSNATVYLFRTDDGGHTWAPIDLELPEGSENAELSIEDIQFVTASDGFLSMRVTGEAINEAVYVTHDSGDTWQLAPALVPDGRASDFVSGTDGFIFDGEKFQVTHDAGQTWEAVESDIAFGDSFVHMDFVNATTGWVTASDPTTFEISLYKTTDGGATWTQQ